MNPFKVLGVSEDANKDTIKKAYKKLCVKWHPDNNNGDSTEFLKIRKAFNMLEKGQHTVSGKCLVHTDIFHFQYRNAKVYSKQSKKVQIHHKDIFHFK